MLSPIRVDRIIPGITPSRPKIRFLAKGVFAAPRYIVTISPGKQLIILKKKHRNRELLNLPSLGYLSVNFRTVFIPAKRPIQYGTVNVIIIPMKLIIRAIPGEKRCPAVICNRIRGINTVALLNAYNASNATAAAAWLLGV